MVEIGGKPILWHILKIYAHHGVNDFVICCGYKGYVIKEYFANYFLHMSDVTFDMRSNRMEVHHKRAEPWNVTLVDTGDDSMTGGRLLRVASYVEDDEAFCFTYGDGVGDIDISRHDRLPPQPRQGRHPHRHLPAGPLRRARHRRRPPGAQLQGEAQGRRRDDQRRLLRALAAGARSTSKDDATVWEQEPLAQLAADGELMAWEHEGFWQPMDTLRDKHLLEELWAAGKAPWKVWD